MLSGMSRAKIKPTNSHKVLELHLVIEKMFSDIRTVSNIIDEPNVAPAESKAPPETPDNKKGLRTIMKDSMMKSTFA